jgi:hypothetical protein
MALTLAFPVWQKENKTSQEKVTLTFYTLSHQKNNKSTQNTSTIYLTVLAIGVGLTAGYSIFRYDKRMIQLGLGLLNSILMSAILGLMMYTILQTDQKTTGQGVYQMGFFLPVIALLANLLANRFIRKDEKLVRSIDRMR